MRTDIAEASQALADELVRNEPRSLRSCLMDAIYADDEPRAHDRFRLSEAGQCPAARTLRRRGIPRLRQVTDMEMWRFWIGKVFHDAAQGQLQKQGVLVDCETEVGDDNFVGHYDGRVNLSDPDEIAEIKTMGPFFYNRLAKSGRPLEENHIVRRYVLQLMSYVLFVCHTDPAVQKGRLLIVRMSLEDTKAGRLHPPLIERSYNLPHWLEAVREDMDTLMYYWKKGDLPPCTCADGDGWWVKRCDYYNGEDCCNG